MSRMHLREWIATHRLTILAFAALLLTAAIVRLLTFDRYLPFWGHSDEPVYFLMVRNWRGLQDNPFIKGRYAGYPPAYPIINWGIQLMVEALQTKSWTMYPEYIYALRLLAAVIGIVTTGIIAFAGFQLGGSVAAWFAGLVWGATPIIVDNNSLALPDPFVYFGSAAALAMALYAWRKESPAWLFGSLIAGIFVIYLKYSPIGALIPWFIVAVGLFRRNPRRMLPWLVAQIAVAALSAIWLILFYGALNAPTREVETFRGPDSLSLALNPQRNLNNWSFAISPIGFPLFVTVIVIAAIAYIYSQHRKWRTLDLLWMAIILLSGVAGIMMTATYTNISIGKIRHALPVTVALIPLWGAGLAQITWALKNWICSQQKLRQHNFLAFLPALIVAAIVITPSVSGDIRLIKDYRRTDMHQIAWQWADNNLPLEGMMLSSSGGYMHYLFNRDWSAYDGRKPFQWWHTDKFDYTPATYAQQGIMYFMASESDLSSTFNTPEAKAFIKQLTLVKYIPLSDQTRGEPVYFYRMISPRTLVSVNFGNQITLIGYDLSKTTAKPSESITIRPYWRIKEHPRTNYSMFIHLYPQTEAQIIAQHDGPPTTMERPTLTWDDPNELYIGQDAKLTIPGSILPGSYRLVLGLYDFNNGQRLLSSDGTDSFVVPIKIES